MTYTYARCERDFNKRSKGKDFKRVFTCDELRKDGEDYVFKHVYLRRHSGEIIARVKPDDTIVLYQPSWAYNPSWSTRVWGIAGIIMYRDATTHGRKAQPVRIKNSWRSTSLPFTNGVMVKAGKIINPEICVDAVRELDREKRLEMQRKLRPWAKLLRVGAKMGLFPEEDYRTYCSSRSWNDRVKDIEGMLTSFSEPTTEQASLIFHFYGEPNWWRYSHMDEPQKTAERMRAANLALRKMTKKLYELNDCYYYERKTA